MAFETLAWHNECFFCHLCKDSMVGKGFIQVGFIMQNHEEEKRLPVLSIIILMHNNTQDGDNIICPECARKKMIEEIEEQ